MTTIEEAPDVAEERHASWLELFFDLLFVAIVAQLAHGLVGQATGLRVLQVGGLFFAAWWVWVSFTYFSDVLVEEDRVHRVWVLATMACLMVMGGGVGAALHGHPALFALGSGLSRLIRPVQWYYVTRRAAGWRALVPYLASAALWLMSAPVPPPWCYGMWAVALAAEIAPVFAGAATETARRARAAIDAAHLVERFGLFVIIVLGEGIAQVVAALGASSSPSPSAVLTGLAAFALLAVVWWLYFDFGNAAALAVLRTRPDDLYSLVRDSLAVGHFLLVGSLLVASAGLGEAVAAAVAGHPADPSATGLICGGLLAYLTNNAVLGIGPLRRGTRAVLTWFVPDAVGTAIVWALAGVITPGWAALIMATVLGAVAARGTLQKATRSDDASRPS
jgi:low temperature requirement protein LtrA